ncbi:MAG: ABC transporter ATP-binding protein, partial [Oleibacter sp.]|nr:ABC transporter ATP-binding protein [Thalassolituus sp.]
MFELSDYGVAYGQSDVISGMDLTVNKNEIVAILGRNGMGKTTLMKSLIGMIPSKSGSIKLDGKEISGLKSHERVGAGVGFVPQGRMIFSTMTVSE